MIQFYSTAPGTSADYQKYLYSQFVKTAREGDSTTLEFSLVPIDGGFVRLRRGNYVKINTSKYGMWYTGYIINDPEPSWIGHNGAEKIWGYSYTASSDDYILNMRPIGFVRPFTNTTQGEILKRLVEVLAPGVFDVSGIDAGLQIARYVVDPKKKFGEIVKEFIDSATYRFSALDHKLVFTESTSASAGFVIDGEDKHFTPSALKLTPSQDPIINDALVIGDLEPQGTMVDYFVGTGYDGQFRLTASPYGVNQALLLTDDFASEDTSKWTYNDEPQNFITVSNNALNVSGGNGEGAFDVNVQSAQVFPLEGNLHVTHGEYDFLPAGATGIINGVVCGMWTADPSMNGSTFPGCLFGIAVNRYGSSVALTNIVNGALDELSLVTDTSKRYIIRTLLGSFVPQRYAQTYSYKSSDGTVHTYTPTMNYTGDGKFNVQTWITEVDPTTGDVSGSWIFFGNVTGLSASTVYATYVPVASNDLHCSVNGLMISVPMQVSLSQKPVDSESWINKVVGVNDIDSLDGSAPEATITDDASGSVQKGNSLGSANMNVGNACLTYFKNSATKDSNIPGKGELIKVTYRRVGASMARVQDSTSVTAEREQWGDTGVRSITRSDLSPAPRNSSECEAAAAALVQNNKYQHYDGSYTIWSDYCTVEPTPGAILLFRNLDSKLPPLVSEVIHEVKTALVSKSEKFTHEVSFGDPDKVRKFLVRFTKQQNAVSVTDTVEMPYFIDTASVGTSFADEVVSPELTGYDNDNYYYDAGQSPPSGGGFEVRYSDDSWGNSSGSNLAGYSTSRLFALPRNSRARVIFVKAYDSAGRRSRFASGVAVYFPSVPPQPSSDATFNFSDTENPVLTIPLPIIQKDVFGVLIADTSSTSLMESDLSDHADWLDSITYTKEKNVDRSFSCFAAYYNVLGEYSAPTRYDLAIPEPVITDLSFNDTTHVVSWDVLQGSPSGYHVVVKNNLSQDNTIPAPALTVQSGQGSLPAGKDIWVRITYVNTYGETKMGEPAKIVNTESNSAILVTPAPVPNWMLTIGAAYQPTKYHIYVAECATGSPEPTSYYRMDTSQGQMQYPRYGADIGSCSQEYLYTVSGYKGSSSFGPGALVGFHSTSFVFSHWQGQYDVYKYRTGDTPRDTWCLARGNGFSLPSGDHWDSDYFYYANKCGGIGSIPDDASLFGGLELSSTLTIKWSPLLIAQRDITDTGDSLGALCGAVIKPPVTDTSQTQILYGAGTVMDTKLKQFTMSDSDWCAASMGIYVTPYDAAGNGVTVYAGHTYTPSGVSAFDNTNNIESIAPPATDDSATTKYSDPSSPFYKYNTDFIDESRSNYTKWNRGARMDL